jgi:HD-like signal output (HDOD) protein
MQTDALRRAIQRLDGIASPSASLDRILELASDCESGIEELTAAIESDPAVTSRVLRLSNSAYYGQPGRVETVSRAIIVIGYRNVVSLAACAAIGPVFRGDDPRVDRAALWLHSCAVAEAARLVAARGTADPSVAYVAGLLHDLGIVVLSEVLGRDYGRVLDTARRRRLALARAEREVLGVDHGWAAGVLFERWSLPARLLAAVSLHHAPQGDESGFAALVCVADHLAEDAGFGGPGRRPDGPPEADVLMAAGLKEVDYRELLEEMADRQAAIEAGAGIGR